MAFLFLKKFLFFSGFNDFSIGSRNCQTRYTFAANDFKLFFEFFRIINLLKAKRMEFTKYCDKSSFSN
jgi:hypothetical protein